jgi:hypothetical protein
MVLGSFGTLMFLRVYEVRDIDLMTKWVMFAMAIVGISYVVSQRIRTRSG